MSNFFQKLIKQNQINKGCVTDFLVSSDFDLLTKEEKEKIMQIHNKLFLEIKTELEEKLGASFGKILTIFNNFFFKEKEAIFMLLKYAHKELDELLVLGGVNHLSEEEHLEIRYNLKNLILVKFIEPFILSLSTEEKNFILSSDDDKDTKDVEHLRKMIKKKIEKFKEENGVEIVINYFITRFFVKRRVTKEFLRKVIYGVVSVYRDKLKKLS